MTVQLTEAPEVLAARGAVIDALTAAGATPLTLAQVKETAVLPEYYTEVTVHLRYTESTRANGHVSLYAFRIGTRVVASVEETAYDEARAVDAGLRNARLVVGGATSTPVQFESSDPVGDDDGKWSALTTWTTNIKTRRAS